MADAYDVVIVGSGPAGMFAARELDDGGIGSILLIDEGKTARKRHCPMEIDGICHKCETCNVMHGVGGAGTFSDGTLNLRPDIGGDLRDLTKDDKAAWDLVKYVDDIWVEYGAPPITERPDPEVVENLMRRAAENDVRFIDIPQRHIGSDYSQKLIDDFERDLRSRGMEFLLETVVEDILIEDRQCKGVIIAGGEEIRGKAVLLAMGRVGSNWLDELVVKHAVNGHFAPMDIGVRVEVANIIMDPITSVNRDPKFHIRRQRSLHEGPDLPQHQLRIAGAYRPHGAGGEHHGIRHLRGQAGHHDRRRQAPGPEAGRPQEGPEDHLVTPGPEPCGAHPHGRDPR